MLFTKLPELMLLDYHQGNNYILQVIYIEEKSIVAETKRSFIYHIYKNRIKNLF